MAISAIEKERAVKYLMQRIEPQDAREMFDDMQREGVRMWSAHEHLLVGIDVRSVLRAGGFNSKEWEQFMETGWATLLEEAVRRIVGKQASAV